MAWCLISVYVGAKKNDEFRQPTGKKNTHTYPHRRLKPLRLPNPPLHVLNSTRTERAHFYPQHRLLCHMGLYKSEFQVEAWLSLCGMFNEVA